MWQAARSGKGCIDVSFHAGLGKFGSIEWNSVSIEWDSCSIEWNLWAKHDTSSHS